MRSLAKHGAKLVFSARNLAAAEKVVAQIKAETPTADVVFYKLDLTSLASVKAFAEEVKTSGVQINTLICNAGKPTIQSSRSRPLCNYLASLSHSLLIYRITIARRNGLTLQQNCRRL